MRVLVCGGRDYNDKGFIYMTLNIIDKELGPIEMILEGGAGGADRLAYRWACETITPVRTYGADWEKHGKGAGPIRNNRMLREGKPDIVVAFPGGKGTAHMVSIAKRAGVDIITPVTE